jgi:eukaryotic-like serine/threonine-protein kinase
VIQRAEGVIVAARYRLVRELGVGGMGKVWLAHDRLLDSPCALKLIDDDKAKSEEVRVRFAREAKVAAQLRGAHVVDVFEHGEWEGTPFIAMEFLDGEDLATRLERLGRLPPADTYRIVAHIARALARAHAYGIVHRDLKPENVFLVPGDDGEVAKVLDFGIAKHDQYSLTDKATKTGSLLGTPYYMSPEQARGKGIDHRSDLWSLGVIAFQCLTGAPPFESEALGELMGLILYEELPKPTVRQPSLPPAVDEWWAKAAARDRDQRFSSAKELADALGVALGLAQNVTVPSVLPGRTSFPDIERIVTPIPDVRRPLSSHPPAVSDERNTDAPLSHTHHSPHTDLEEIDRDLFSRRPGTKLYKRLQSARRRQLVGAAVVLGIGAGVALTVLFTGQTPPAVPPTPPAAALPVVTPPPTPTVEALPSVPTVVPAPTAEAAAPSASALVDPAPSDKSKSKASKSKPPAPATKSGGKTRRDYGI